jgi:hypothetical protein
MSLALEEEKLTPEQVEARRVEELKNQAETRKRLDDEAARQRLMQRTAGNGNALRG